MGFFPNKCAYFLVATLAAAVASHALFDFWSGAVSSDSGHSLPARLVARGERIPLLIQCREQPLQFSPNRGLEKTVTEDDLVSVLCAAFPYWDPPPVPAAMHELKLWGKNAVFTNEMWGAPRTGNFLIETLLSDKLCRANTSRYGETYLLDSPFGIRPVLLGSEDGAEMRGESHYGQLLMILGEVGVQASTRVTTSSGSVGSIKDVYQDAIMRFSFSRELEFIGSALAYWQPPQKTWKDQFGNEYSFDQLLSRLLTIPFGKGSCGGCHVIYTIVSILRADKEHSILTEATRESTRIRLAAAAHLLETHLTATGGWDRSWSQTNLDRSLIPHDELMDRITITGHHLEWIALAPDGLRPSERVVSLAVKALRSDVESLPPLHRRSFKTLLPASHGARALALLRGDDPFSVWIKYWNNGWLQRTDKGLAINKATK